MKAAASKYEDDLALARSAHAGNRAAMRDIAHRLLDRVRTTVRYVSADDRDQDDWVQLAMIEILRSLGNFRGESLLETGSDRITIRTAMRHLKQRRGREKVVVLDPEARRRERNDSQDSAEMISVRRHLAAHLRCLTPQRRSVVVLKLVYGYSIEEISQLTDAPVNTVRDRLRLGRKKLRSRITKDPVLRDMVRHTEV